MDCATFVRTGWKDHAEDEQGVYRRLPNGFALVSEPADLTRMAGLVVHVAGEHLGRWAEGIALLDQLLACPPALDPCPQVLSVWRSKAVLLHCLGDVAGSAQAAQSGRSDGPEASDQVRIFAIAASALAGQRRMGDAAVAFTRATEAAQTLPEGDPAEKSLAICSHNLACALEVSPNLDAGAQDLLRTAAFAARTWWAKAGTWGNVKGAEYVLARAHIALGEPQTAIHHATTALRLCTDHDAGPSDTFFPHEVMARARHAAGDLTGAAAARDQAAAALDAVSDEATRRWMQGELDTLDASLRTEP
jgi:hypothetical protein